MSYDAIADLFALKLAQVASDADAPRARRQIPVALINTEPIETCDCWWSVRAWVLATDRDKVGLDFTMGERLAGRFN